MERKRKEKVDGAVSLLNLKTVSQFWAVMALFSQIVMAPPASNSVFSAKFSRAKCLMFCLPVFSFRVIDNLPVATTFELEGKVHVN